MKPGKLTVMAFVLAFASGATLAAAADTTSATEPGVQNGSGPARMGEYGRKMMGGYGPGMMGGYGPGMMRGYGPGMAGAYGPGMMRGYGHGMMGGYDPGMMGGYGPGMMGGYGPGNGPRWGRGYALSQLDLTNDQKQKIAGILENAREQNWATMGQLRTEEYRLRSLYNTEKPDPDAVAEQQKKVDDLRRQLTKARVQAHNEMQTVLTKEQREQLRANAPWWAEGIDIGD